MTDTLIAETLFYAAQSAYAYRSSDIVQWEQATSDVQDGFASVADTLAALPEAPVDAAAQAIIEPLHPLVPGGINRTWEQMDGRSRYNLIAVVEAYRRATAPDPMPTVEQWDALFA